MWLAGHAGTLSSFDFVTGSGRVRRFAVAEFVFCQPCSNLWLYLVSFLDF